MYTYNINFTGIPMSRKKITLLVSSYNDDNKTATTGVQHVRQDISSGLCESDGPNYKWAKVTDRTQDMMLTQFSIKLFLTLLTKIQ
jgi:hypothetical protein